MPLVFNYGSNHPAQVAERVGCRAKPFAALLPGYRRVFQGFSQRWNGAPATVVPAMDAVVPGYVCAFTDAELERMDGFEGVASGYYRREQLPVTVHRDGQWQVESAWVYLMRDEPEAPPSEAYLAAVSKTVNLFWQCADGTDVSHAALAQGEDQSLQLRSPVA